MYTNATALRHASPQESRLGHDLPGQISDTFSEAAGALPGVLEPEDSGIVRNDALKAAPHPPAGRFDRESIVIAMLRS
jgi:hypothetical protein